MGIDTLNVRLTESQFEKISKRMYEECGVNLHNGKEELVKSRLVKRLRALNMESFEEYIQYLESSASCSELALMIDSLTTNKTSFFREPQHFDFLVDNILPVFKAQGGRFTIWSAGCSSGEEPYTLAMLVKEHIGRAPGVDVRILATDISTRVLSKVRDAVYSEDIVSEVPPQYRKYFRKVSSNGITSYQVVDDVKSLVKCARLNLMAEWPMKGPFDAIFCRNVMIYFDKPTQQKLISRYWGMLRLGGHLFVGHSESLTGTNQGFKYVKPAVYQKQ